MHSEKNKLIGSVSIPLVLLFVMWVVKLVEVFFDTSFVHFGTYPLRLNGLQGIALMPFIHSGFNHLLANSGSFLILSVALFYFYRDLSLKVLIWIWLL